MDRELRQDVSTYLSGDITRESYVVVSQLVWEAHRAMTRALQARLAENRLNIGTWRFLRALWAEDGISQKTLGDRAGLTPSTTAAALSKMEKQGLITRKRSRTDGRTVNVFLTSRSKQLEQKLLPLAMELNRHAVSGIADRDLRVMHRALKTICANSEALLDQY